MRKWKMFNTSSFFIVVMMQNGFAIGEAPLFVRLQSKKQNINHKFCTPLTVDIEAWNNSKKGDTQRKNFRKANKDLVQKMLKKYIKADSLEVVEKLTDKYEYFR